MDPERLLLDLIDAAKQCDFTTARNLAGSLRTWLAAGGFYPRSLSREQTNEFVATLLRFPAQLDDATEFSLCCAHCDAGMEIDTLDQAIRNGWTDIAVALDLLQANFVGICPDCKNLD